MSEWKVYSTKGVEKAQVKELELHDEWMAECYLTVTVKSANPVNFQIGDTSHSTLCQVGISLIECTLANQCHLASPRHFQCEAHSGNTRTYDEIVIFVNHNVMRF